METKAEIEMKVVLQAIKGKIEIFKEMELEEKSQGDISRLYLYGAARQTLKGIEEIILKELSNIESEN
ncbi:hypothetical protein I5735_15230 [Acinetobacter baumannii]|nr:hypothetical protein [Acinetobacter baumannii]